MSELNLEALYRFLSLITLQLSCVVWAPNPVPYRRTIIILILIAVIVTASQLGVVLHGHAPG